MLFSEVTSNGIARTYCRALYKDPTSDQTCVFSAHDVISVVTLDA